ncbi:RCC1 domain-containing protein [Streptomyces antibioticus]|uniref:Chromosome condensation regulator RCC1 n=1 Tax=Streptomyces antibioticus TaxID=1890 RepID=A0AAE6YF83_STRAT|nr:chromosome condensation regulator RCC1 [Streptomyces antibioticus]MCX5173338.1 chromosome condensation regulator RCC1 [Streptomyces antibioticus]OOQ48448.1 chromosome condensation regulator RCC1 [Streptomyces antibioticus]QIT48342.1 chromosome condensation regulator RCC1 [Streptomyces antibioticus]
MTPPLRRTLLTAVALTTVLAAPCLTAPAAAGTDPWVRAWGENAQGQLGNGGLAAQQTATAVTGIARDDVRELSAGGGGAGAAANPFAVALLKDGTVKSWGSNATGQLGNGTLVSQPVPVTVAGLWGVSEVSAGANHALAVRAGRVLAWGSNARKQLGTGLDTTNPYRAPVPVQSLDEVRDVGAGCDFSVALRQDGTVWTWGSGANGRLGTGANTDRDTPQKVPDLTDVESVSVGCDHVLALTADGTVKAWGRNTEGQLGNDSTADSNKPVDVAYLDAVAEVFATSASGFAVLDDGSLAGWGKNSDGQLGDGTKSHRTTPVVLDQLRGVQQVAGGADFTIAALDDGSVIGWGANAAAQLGDGTTTSPASTTVALPPGSGITHVTTTITGKSGYAY